jgi:hypothetical protein
MDARVPKKPVVVFPQSEVVYHSDFADATVYMELVLYLRQHYQYVMRVKGGLLFDMPKDDPFLTGVPA